MPYVDVEEIRIFAVSRNDVELCLAAFTWNRVEDCVLLLKKNGTELGMLGIYKTHDLRCRLMKRT